MSRARETSAAPKRALVELLRDPDAEPEQRPLDLHLLRRLFEFTRPHRRTRDRLFVLVVLRAIQLPALGWSVAALISGPIAARDAGGTALGVAGFSLLALSTAIVFHYRIKLALELGEAVVHDLRAAIVERLFSLPLAFFQGQRVGRLISRFTSDLEAVRVGVKEVAFVSTVQLGSMWIAGVLMALYDWLLFLVVAALVPVLAFVIQRFRRKLMDAYRATQESFSRVIAAVAESIAGIRVSQAFDRGAHNSELFHAQIHRHAECNVETARCSAVFLPLLEFNGQVFLALLLMIGGYRALHGQIAFEVLVQFFFLAQFFFGPIAVLGNQYAQALAAMAGAERVFTLLDVRPAYGDRPDAQALPRVRGRVEFFGVRFGYDPGRPVLQAIELEAEPGETIALVGPSGSGKSTLLGLLARFHVPQAGVIAIDRIDLQSVTETSLRAQLGYVLQENFLFSGSILDNIRLARPSASDAQIREAARALDVVDFIEALPRGWETQVGERGGSLSLGQRQILCFTRAMLADPRLLLLDEATSALDPRTEQLLQAALARLLAGRTSFIVAHRLSTIRHANQVLVLNQGRIIERGTHAALLDHGGAYARLSHQLQGGSERASLV